VRETLFRTKVQDLQIKPSCTCVRVQFVTVRELGTFHIEKSYHSPMRQNELWTPGRPHLQSKSPWSDDQVGTFEEEEGGVSVTSDVTKVKGKDPATPG